MKLAILGATGPLGAKLLELALKCGASVRVLARSPTKLAFRHAALEVIEGNYLDHSALRETIRDCDVVLSTIGPQGPGAIPRSRAR